MSDTAAPRAWRLVLERIESELLDGHLGPGDRLPSERDLASELGVGRSSVREALRVLEVMGLIRTATGSGPQAGAIVIAAPGGGMSAFLRLQVAAHGFALRDVMETRLVLESAVAVALSKDGDRDLTETHRLLDAMDEETLSPAEFLALDAQLHLSLAQATGNTVVAAMMAGLRSSIESYVTAGAEHIEDWAAMAARLRAEHRALVETIEDGNAESAEELVRSHITGYYAAAGLTRTLVAPPTAP